MKFEDALKRIKGAESVGGQLIVNRGGRNVLVGKSVQGTLILEDDDEARGIALEVDKNAVKDGVLAEQDADDKSILSTHPVEAALRPTEPMPNVAGEDQPASHMTQQYNEENREDEDARKPPAGSDVDTPKPNTERPEDAARTKAANKAADEKSKK